MYINGASQLMGIFDFLIEWLFGLVLTIFQVIIAIIEFFASQLLYTIGGSLLTLIDFFQDIFSVLAGISPHYIRGTAQDNDIVLSLIYNKSIQNVFLAMGIMAVALLIMTTIIAIIKVEYSQEGAKNSKGNILGVSIKALALFLTVPAVSFMGIFAGNQVLKSIQGAFSAGNGGTTQIAGAIFKASVGSANKMMIAAGHGEKGLSSDVKEMLESILSFNDEDEMYKKDVNGNIIGYSSDYDNGGMFIDNTSSSNHERLVNISDAVTNAFAQKISLEGKTKNSVVHIIVKNGSNTAILAVINPAYAVISAILVAGETAANYTDLKLDYTNMTMVQMYYSLSSINYLILIAGSIFAIIALYHSLFGLMMRLFKAVTLLIISPAIISIMPLENGKAYSQWRTNFIGTVISAYGIVVALNAMFLIIGAIDASQLTIFPNTIQYQGMNNFINLIIILVGLNMIKDISKLISQLIGSGDDVFSSGEGMSKKVKSQAMKSAGLAVGGSGIGGALARRNFKKKEIGGLQKKGKSLEEDLQNAIDNKESPETIKGIESKIADNKYSLSAAEAGLEKHKKKYSPTGRLMAGMQKQMGISRDDSSIKPEYAGGDMEANQLKQAKSRAQADGAASNIVNGSGASVVNDNAKWNEASRLLAQNFLDVMQSTVKSKVGDNESIYVNGQDGKLQDVEKILSRSNAKYNNESNIVEGIKNEFEGLFNKSVNDTMTVSDYESMGDLAEKAKDNGQEEIADLLRTIISKTAYRDDPINGGIYSSVGADKSSLDTAFANKLASIEASKNSAASAIKEVYGNYNVALKMDFKGNDNLDKTIKDALDKNQKEFDKKGITISQSQINEIKEAVAKTINEGNKKGK